MRVVLHVRAFERALPRTAGEHWNDAVKRYFREFWALDSFASALFEIAHASELIIRRHAFDELDRLEQWLVRDGERPAVSSYAIVGWCGSSGSPPGAVRHRASRLRQRSKPRATKEPSVAPTTMNGASSSRPKSAVEAISARLKSLGRVKTRRGVGPTP